LRLESGGDRQDLGENGFPVLEKIAVGESQDGAAEGAEIGVSIFVMRSLVPI